MRIAAMVKITSFHLLLALALAACGQLLEPDTSFFSLQENVDSAELFPMPRCGNFQLEEATIDQMQEAMSNGTLTSVQLATCYMMRTYQTEDYAK